MAERVGASCVLKWPDTQATDLATGELASKEVVFPP